MHKINWYFKQSVAFADMRFQDDNSESAHQVGLKEGGQPVGIVSGYEVLPHTGMQLQIGTTASVAYDKLGHRLAPTTFPIIQSIASATEGGTTSAASGKERWVSVFARFGRKFTEAATDGSGNAVRKNALECINALGEGSHGLAAYDATLAKEAGVDKFYVVAGAEDTIHTAVRPNLIDDGILICDVLVTNGMTTPTSDDIFYDRQQRLVPAPMQAKIDWMDRYQDQGGSPKHGIDKYSFVNGDASNLIWQVSDGRGYVDDGSAWAGPEFLHRYEFKSPVYLPAPAPPASEYRRDVIVVDENGAAKVIQGPPSPGNFANPPAAPVLPANVVPIMEVLAQPGFPETASSPKVRAGFRKAPFPFSTMTGIVQGCKLRWNWPDSNTSTLYIGSEVNKILFNGELVEFDNHGLDTHTEPAPRFPALQDAVGNPFSGAAGAYHKPYYIYACRKQFQISLSPEVSTPRQATNVCLIESNTGFDADTGHPFSPLNGPSGTIAPEDCLLIGIGWVRAGSLDRVPVMVGPGGWFTPLHNATHNYISIPGNSNHAAVHMPGAPYGCVNARALVTVSGNASNFPSMEVYDHNHPTAVLFKIYERPTGASTLSTTIGEYTFPMNGNDYIVCTTTELGAWGVKGTSFQVPIRRVAGTDGLF